MNAILMLNGPLLILEWPIFLFQMLHHANHPCNEPRIAGPFITSDFYMKDDPTEHSKYIYVDNLMITKI